MNAIYQWIGKIGENLNLIAFFAHGGVACSILLIAKGNYWVMTTILVVAAFKEFYLDMKYEENPPQTFMDSFDDFIGYACGVVVALISLHL